MTPHTPVQGKICSECHIGIVEGTGNMCSECLYGQKQVKMKKEIVTPVQPKEKLPLVCDIEFIADGESICYVCGIGSFSHIHKEGTLPKDFERIDTPPQEAEWEKELEEWWLEHEKTFAVPVAVTIDDMLIFIRKLLQEQKEKVVEETLNIMFSFEKEAGDACSASGGEDKRACDEATDWQIKREQVFNALKKKI